MRRFFAILICAMLAFSLPIVVFAEEDPTEETMPTEQEESTTTEEVATEEPSQEEPIVDTDVQTETPTEVPPADTTVTEEPTKTTTDLVVDYIKANLDDISVVVTLIGTILYQMRKHKVLNKSIGVLNNNAVTVAENSNNAIQTALAEVGGLSGVVTGYKEDIEILLAEFRANAEDKKRLEDSLAEMQTYLKTAKLANMELANELAELLVLANIPNSKKEELYSRHLAAVGAIADAEKTEVIADDGREAE